MHRGNFPFFVSRSAITSFFDRKITKEKVKLFQRRGRNLNDRNNGIFQLYCETSGHNFFYASRSFKSTFSDRALITERLINIINEQTANEGINSIGIRRPYYYPNLLFTARIESETHWSAMAAH